MAAMYDKPVRILMQEMIPALGISPGDTFTRDQAVQWFAENYPKIKQGTIAAHLVRLSTNVRTRLQYSVRPDGSDDHFFKIDSSTFRIAKNISEDLRLACAGLQLARYEYWICGRGSEYVHFSMWAYPE